MAERSNAKVCKTFARKGYVGSNPALGTNMILRKKYQKLWKVIMIIATVALILTSIAPFISSAFK